MKLDAVIALLLIATVTVFFLGIRSMTRGGAYDRHRSGELMLARVELQALTLALVALAAWLASI